MMFVVAFRFDVQVHDKIQIVEIILSEIGLGKAAVLGILLREAIENGSVSVHDSQGICFLGKVNYNDFIRRYLGEKEGPIVEFETGKILGTHKGYWFHTVGQRKGLGLSGGPWYVVKKDVDANLIWVSKGYETEFQYGTGFDLRDFHFITENT